MDFLSYSELLSSVAPEFPVGEKRVYGKPFLLAAMSESLERSTNISLFREPVVKKLCEVLDKSSNKGWRKLGDIVSSDRRFKVR